MAESMIITPVVEQSVAFVFSHTYQEIQYIWKFKTNIQTLTNTMTSLETRREAIRLLIDAAKRNAEVIGPDVEEWMQKVELTKNEVDEILQETRNSQIGCCFNCKCPNLKVRYSLSKKASIKTIEIANLQGKGEFTRVGYPGPIGRRPFLSSPGFVGFESRRLVEENVMKAVLDENIPIIAICGMGGVGKTTMVRKIADIIKKENHFDEVVMAVVSQNYDPINVQQQLAEKLGLEIKETTLDARADRLHTRLMDKKKRILLIIDDLWEEIKLGDIGIPTEVDRKGLKVILTSRLPGICSNMYVKEIIAVGILIEEEAWALFKEHANISDDDSDVLEGYPKKVADKCQGLPLAIEVIGKALKDRKHLFEWRDAFQRLNSAHDSDTSENKVYSSIKWSVDFLERQHKSLLLLCSLFPDDYEIEVEDLVRYAKGLEFVKGTKKMSETRDRVGTIIHVLTDCYLLIACDNYCVKLHDVVRDTCLRIASKGESVFMVSHSILKEWPDRDTYDSYTAISLGFDSNPIELPSGLNCSSLQLLSLYAKWTRNNILNNLTRFLEETEELRVLNINGLVIELPQKLQTSMSLRTLNLHNCLLNGDLSALLERLDKVEVLSFFNSTYKGKWPKEIGKLSNLKSLDMRFRSGPSESLPTGILIHLKKLEELYLNLKLQICLDSYEIVEEIGSLSNLNTIWISGFNFPSLALLVNKLDVERLSRFYFSPAVERWLDYQFSRTMRIYGANMGMLLEPKMKALLSKVDESLQLYGVTGFNNDFDGGSVFSRSRNLELRNCEMKYICNTTNSAQGVFVHLKRLSIHEAKHLEELCHGNIPPGSFVRLEELRLYNVPLLSCLWGPIEPPCLGNLAILKIHESKLITSLVLRSSVKCFAQLRVLGIKSCPKLETIVSWDGKIENDAVEDMPFKKLEELYLDELDSFKTLCSEQEAPNTVFVEKMVASLKVLHLHRCPKVRIDEKIPWRMIFDQLEHLSLWDLPQFISFRRMLPEGTVAFQKLLILKIEACFGLRYLFTPLMVRMLGSLKELVIKDCRELESIIGREEDDEVTTMEEEIGFPELCELTLCRLPGLRMICSEPVNLSLPHWNKFALYDCPRINKFCAGNLNAPKLKQVSFLKDFYYGGGDDIHFVLDLETMRNWFKDCELRKRCIVCASYAKGKTCYHLAEGSSTNEQ